MVAAMDTRIKHIVRFSHLPTILNLAGLFGSLIGWLFPHRVHKMGTSKGRFAQHETT